MMSLVLFALATFFIRIQGNPVPDVIADDCPEGSGDCTPMPPPATTPPPGSPPPPQPSGCGVRPATPSSRIVGGHETQPNSIPWQAMLRTDGGQFCGGSLIHPRWVLSAAHCVEGESPGGFKIRLGAHQREATDAITQDFNVIQIVVHSQYNSPANANDMALIKLDRDAVLGPGVGLICLGDDGSHLPIDDLNNQCLISGWGTLSSGGNQPNVLHEVMVPLVSRSRCENAYGSMHDSMLCAGLEGGGKDSCQGDSGGPLACKYADGKYYLEGATSWGEGCASAGKYGVYAKVRPLRSFIDSTIQG